MGFGTTITFFILFVLLYMISMSIENPQHKMSFWLIVALALITIFNIYLSIMYYIKLRNEKGIPGPRGESGAKGPKGESGLCTTSAKCGIQECRSKIMDKVIPFFPDIPVDCINDNDMCETSTNKQKAAPIRVLIDDLEKKCRNTKRSEESFMRKILPNIESQMNLMNNEADANTDNDVNAETEYPL